MSEHAPNIKTQVGLLQLRGNSRRNEAERRRVANRTMDEDDDAEAAEIRGDHLTPDQKRLRNAEQTIIELVQQSAVFSRAIQHLVQAWPQPGRHEEALDEVDQLVDRLTDEVYSDPAHQQASTVWAQERIEKGPSKARPRVRRKPR